MVNVSSSTSMIIACACPPSSSPRTMTWPISALSPPSGRCSLGRVMTRASSRGGESFASTVTFLVSPCFMPITPSSTAGRRAPWPTMTSTGPPSVFVEKEKPLVVVPSIWIRILSPFLISDMDHPYHGWLFQFIQPRGSEH